MKINFKIEAAKFSIAVKHRLSSQSEARAAKLWQASIDLGYRRPSMVPSREHRSVPATLKKTTINYISL